MRRFFAAVIAFACLVIASPAEAKRQAPQPTCVVTDRNPCSSPNGPWVSHNYATPRKKVKREGRVTHRKVKRTARIATRTLGGYAKHIASTSTKDLSGFPEPLVRKVREIQSDCGSKIVSAFRPGARVCGRRGCVMSNHARRRAVDVQGNPSCIYDKLKGFPGGVSTDYATAPGGAHVHISYNPGSMEWGTRFAHSGKSVSRRYASRKYRYATAGGG